MGRKREVTDNQTGTETLAFLQSQQLAYQYVSGLRPKILFKGDGKADFEHFFMQFEAAINTPGMTAKLSLLELKFWWGGIPAMKIERFLLRQDAEEALKEAIGVLKKEYGKRRTSPDEMLETLLKGEKILSKEIEAADEFVTKLENTYYLALDTKRGEEFNRKALYEEILKKKLPHYRYKWVVKWSRNEETGSEPLFFIDFLDYLKLAVRVEKNMNRGAAWSNVNSQRENETTSWKDGWFGQQGRTWNADANSGVNKSADANSGAMVTRIPSADMEMTEMTEINSGNVEPCNELFCQLCEETHGLMDCPTFATFNPDERSEVCFRNKLCFKCLRAGHLASKCMARIRCTVCRGNHHELLHVERN